MLRFSLFENGIKIVPKDPYLLDKLEKEAEFDLTLVVPAYNEESRLPIMMKETLEVSIYRYLIFISAL